ncbi:MAG: diaminopimelate decarboxylase [Candidatus Neomarinimicrobiota bacterium]
MNKHPLLDLIDDKVLLSSLAAEYGTPLYVYSAGRLQTNLLRLDRALKNNFTKYHICYAVKANCNPALIAAMHGFLPTLGTDCASPGEIHATRLAGIATSDSIYTGNFESPGDLIYAIESGININLDDISSLERLARIGLPPRVSFRLNPGFGKGMFSQITTGGEKAKFGVPRHLIIDAYCRAQSLGIKRFGLQAMTGSGVLDDQYFPQLLQALIDVAKELKSELGMDMEYISIGGGIGIPYRDDQQTIPIDRVMTELGQVFHASYDQEAPDCPALWLEPGKYIVGDTGFILATVTGLKQSYRTFVGLNAGMETILRPALYDAHHRFYKVGATAEAAAGTVDFTGQICENTDRQAIDRPFPTVAEGDLIAIMDAGAYGFAMSQQLNSRPRAAEVLLTDAGPRLIRNRETIEDIYAKCLY